MSNLPVPRKAELVLEALSADTEFRDAVLGDLAEEYALRMSWDGPLAARRWYYREGLRVAPYLIRDWWRRRRGRDAGHVANAVLWSSMSMITVQVIVFGIGWGIAVKLGLTDAVFTHFWEPPFGMVFLCALMLLWTPAHGAVAGCVAASVGRRAPLPSVLALAATWASLLISVNMLAIAPVEGPAVPVWLRVANVGMLVAGMIAGGVSSAGRDRGRPTGASLVD